MSADGGVEDAFVEQDGQPIPIEDDTPPPEGAGPAASVEDFSPDDPDPEAIIDEL